jgi:hypothetical protein
VQLSRAAEQASNFAALVAGVAFVIILALSASKLAAVILAIVCGISGIVSATLTVARHRRINRDG